MTGAGERQPRGQGMRAERLSLFATPLAVCVLPDSEDMKAPLAALALAGRQGSPDDGFLDGGKAEPHLAPLIAAAVALADAMETVPAGAWDVAWRSEALRPGEGGEVHAIPAALWCAHYLIDAGGGDGALELQDPRGAAPVMYAPGLTFAAEGAETLGVSQSIGLKEGALAVFPAWMLQSTALHQGDRPRLSLTLRLRRRTKEA